MKHTLSLSFTKDEWASIYGALTASATFIDEPKLLVLANKIRYTYKQTYSKKRPPTWQ